MSAAPTLAAARRAPPTAAAALAGAALAAAALLAAPGAAARVALHADVNPAAEKSTHGQHDRRGAKFDAALRHHTHGAPALDRQVGGFLLENLQVGLGLEQAADRALVELPIGLGARRPHRRPLARVQGAELDSGRIGGQRHRTAERVDLLDEMPLADPAYGRVAAHLAQGLDVVREQQRLPPHARGRQRGLGARVAAADHDDVESLAEAHHAGSTDTGMPAN